MPVTKIWHNFCWGRALMLCLRPIFEFNRFCDRQPRRWPATACRRARAAGTGRRPGAGTRSHCTRIRVAPASESLSPSLPVRRHPGRSVQRARRDRAQASESGAGPGSGDRDSRPQARGQAARVGLENRRVGPGKELWSRPGPGPGGTGCHTVTVPGPVAPPPSLTRSRLWAGVRRIQAL